MFSSIKTRLSDLFFTAVGFAMAYTLVPLHEGFQKLQVGRTDSVLKARLKLLLLVPIILLVTLPITLIFAVAHRLAVTVTATLAIIWSTLGDAWAVWNHEPMTKAEAELLDFLDWMTSRQRNRGF